MSTLSAPYATRLQERLRRGVPTPQPSATQVSVPSTPTETRTNRVLRSAHSRNKGARGLSPNIQRAASPSPLARRSPKEWRACLSPMTNDKEIIHLLPVLRSLTRPILTLPYEMITEIFIYVRDPTLVAQICHHLRAIALSCPSLWSTILVILKNHNLPMQLAKAKEWSTRSCRCPLSVTIEGVSRMKDYVSPCELYNGFLLPMLSHHDTVFRLERLIVRMDLWSSSLDILKTPMPRLRHLAISSRDITGKVTIVIPPETFPRLRSLELGRVKNSFVELSFTQITTLRVDDIEYPQLREILGQTTTLLHCEVGGIVIRPFARNDPQMLRLEYLQSLVFTRCNRRKTQQDPIFPIATMTLPSLCILQVPEIYLHSPSYKDLLAFVERSGCRLQELRIIDPASASKATLRDKLACVPTLSFHRRSPV
ncbi:hypothetical protein C8R47DRAFT_1229401 [Mycena vitilis]|nr:hypothetical protein C8R47DRAFT_1229401 [Mycena vitilis]